MVIILISTILPTYVSFIYGLVISDLVSVEVTVVEERKSPHCTKNQDL